MNCVKNKLLAGVSTAVVLEFLVILFLLLPAGGEETSGAAAQAVEPLRIERRLTASVPAEAVEAAEDEAEDAEPEEVREKEKPEGERSAPEILADTAVIAHGMGSIEGLTLANCLEGFLEQYEAGVRVFEADLRLTRDGQVVLRHDWWPADWQDGISWAQIPTREKFVSTPILGQYTPLSFRDLLLLMEEYPDICIVTDSKFTESDVFTLQFDAMLADAHELGLTYLFDRIFIQVYTGNMRTALHNIYPFPHYIYTLYQDGFMGTVEEFRTKAAYCKERGIEGITMESSWWDPEFAAISAENGVKVYVHTVNDPVRAQELLVSGVDAVYSDSLTPGDLFHTAKSRLQDGSLRVSKGESVFLKYSGKNHLHFSRRCV